MNAILDSLQSELGVERHSDWLTVDQPMIDQFADATQDRQFIHIDPVRAAETPFGGTVAHGFLTLSLLAPLQMSIQRPTASDMGLIINYGVDRVRFITPVRSGTRIRALSTLIEVEEREPMRFHQAHEIIVEIEARDKPALIAIWRTLLVL